jgi:hypothetical protein
MRTARLPSDALQSDPLRALLPEIRRTIAAVHARSHGQQVEQVFLCGEGSAQGLLAREIGRELDLPTEVFNPLTCCTVSGDLRRNMPEHASRFAPLIGMLMDEGEPGIATIDFLNPRRRPVAPSKRRQWTIAAAAAVLLVGIGAIWIWLQLGSLDSQIADANDRLRQMDPGAKLADDNLKKAAEVEKWLGADVNWLDEMARLAAKVPPAQDLMLTLVSTPSDYLKNTANLHVEGLARNTSIVEQLPQSLRDDQHEVTPRSAVQDDRGHKDYPWQVKTDIRINPAKTSAPPVSPQRTSGATTTATNVQAKSAVPVDQSAPSSEATTP